MGFRVGLTYNVKTEYVFRPGDPPDANAEYDHEDTIGVIERALRGGGHEVVRLGSPKMLLANNGAPNVDIIFNIAEGEGGRNRESQAPILMEMFHIPYVGADGLTLGLTLDKITTKKVLIAEGIPTAKFAELRDPEDVWKVDLGYPLIVKPRYEGSSKGVSESSLVNNAQELHRQVKWLVDTYKQPALVEAFIEGTEFTVPILGNDPPQAQAVFQIQLEGKLDLGRLFYTFARIRNGSSYVCPAPVDEALRQRIADIALATYRVVECRDFGRVDIRVDRAGNPYVLEINPLPSLSTEDVYALLAKLQGISYEAMLNRVLDIALVRHGMKTKEEVVVPSAMF